MRPAIVAFNMYLFRKYLMNAVLCCAVLRRGLTLCDPMDPMVHQDPLSIGFSRKEYQNGLLFLPSMNVIALSYNHMAMDSEIRQHGFKI